MTQTYSDGKYIYSVKDLIKHVKTIVSSKIKTKNIYKKLKNKQWGNPYKPNISPMNVIKNKDRYIKHHKRIIKSDLRHPIIVDKKYNIIDGNHRLAKAYLLNKKYIRIYVINDLTPFILAKDTKKGYMYVDSMS